MVEKRLGNLEKSMTDIKVNQSSISQSVAGINKTLAELVDIRAETLHLVKSQEEARVDRDEIFKRLRQVEAGREGCMADQRHVKSGLGKLETDVDQLKTWKTTHVTTQQAAEKAGLKAGRFWGLWFGAVSILISAIGLYLKITGKIK